MKVGHGTTQASFRINSPQELPDVLELLLAARTDFTNHTHTA